MAANAAWIMQGKNSLIGITKPKLIVWTHNSHSSKCATCMPDVVYQESLCEYKPEPCGLMRAGQLVKSQFGDSCYIAGATAFSGNSGTSVIPCSYQTPYMTISAPYGALEYFWNAAGFPNASFLDLSGQSYAIPDWLQLQNLTLARGFYDSNTLTPSVFFDGLIYYKTMEGITCYN
jgi:erythromycin esterase-like protein